MKKFLFAMLAVSALIASCAKGDGGKIDPTIIKIPALEGIVEGTDELCINWPEPYEDMIICRAPYSAATGCILKLPAGLSESFSAKMMERFGMDIYMGLITGKKDGEDTRQHIAYGNSDAFVMYVYAPDARTHMGIMELNEGWNFIFTDRNEPVVSPMPASGLSWMVY